MCAPPATVCRRLRPLDGNPGHVPGDKSRNGLVVNDFSHLAVHAGTRAYRSRQKKIFSLSSEGGRMEAHLDGWTKMARDNVAGPPALA